MLPKNPLRRIYIKTYGCQMNERDSEVIGGLLVADGHCLVEDEEGADVVLLNTCSVRDLAEQKAIGKAGRLLRRKRMQPELIVGILGCMAQNRGDKLLKTFPKLDLIMGPKQLAGLADALKKVILGEGPVVAIDGNGTGHEGHFQANAHHFRSQERKVCAFVSIIQGCGMHCAYCIVPKTRGEEQSRPMESILDEIRGLAERGTKEITLLGQIVNRYGQGCLPTKEGKTPFVQLLEKINEVPGIERIRMQSPHPTWFGEDLIQAYVDLPKLCPTIHLPLQSASNKILRAMRRPYTKEAFSTIIEKLRNRLPLIGLSTDIIVGFPGETDADFEETRAFMEQIGFDMAFIFKYSLRTGTPAESLGDSIDESVKDARNQQLLQILETSSKKSHAALVSTTQLVLVEGKAKKGDSKWMGRTPTNHKVILDGDESLLASIVTVKIEGATVAVLMGKRV